MSSLVPQGALELNLTLVCCLNLMKRGLDMVGSHQGRNFHCIISFTESKKVGFIVVIATLLLIGVKREFTG